MEGSDDELKIEIETESNQKPDFNEEISRNRRIQTIKYKSKIWVQDSAFANKDLRFEPLHKRLSY
jgi:hypothetical protein